MTVALFASDKIALPEIASILSREGVTVSTQALTTRLSRNDVELPITKGFLITTESGLVNIGEQAEQVRELMGSQVGLVLCAPRPAFSDREFLRECGAGEIVSPQSWNAQHVVDRLLGQMIVDGDVLPFRLGSLWGGTSKIRAIYSQIETLGPLSEPILILGETGTGKDLVAREIHNSSGRGNSYVPVNCPELHGDLISSELFGHERGAFTGADKSRVGLIASAGKGTVFLDEIGDLDLQSQAKLLRVLEDRKVRRIGANQMEEVKARLILATNRDLDAACNEGAFRQDLYERIRGFIIELPPLRQRKADIPLLVNHFVDEFNQDYGTAHKMPDGGVDFLFQHSWPGNVRELRATIRRAAAYSDSSGAISSLVLHESVRRTQAHNMAHAVPFEPATDTWRDLLLRAQKTYFHALLNHTNGNREAAIKLSGLSRSQFFEKIRGIFED